MRTLYSTLLFIMCFQLITIGQNNDLIPPADLKAEHVLDDPNVTLSWWEPGTPNWLHYDSGEFVQSIGFDAEVIFDAAIKYEPGQLLPFNGMQISQIAFVPAESAATYSIHLWMGNEADSLVYEQELNSLTINDWNIIELDSVLILDAEATWYFGYHVNTTAGFPVGCDAGPAKAPGKCDLIRTDDGLFESLYNYGLDMNFCLQVYLTPNENDGIQKIALTTENQNHAKILTVTSEIVKESKLLSRPKVAGTPDSYNIYRDNVNIATAENNSYADVLPNGGIYTYEVTAVYGSEESVKSNSVEVLYDNNRIYPNTIIAEAMINVGGGSGGSPGAYLGMYEMNYEFEKFAPIIYHNAVDILGPDPFSNADSEERFMEYFMLTGAYPMAIFQGMALAGGGSGESLYEYYRGAYESVLDFKTPLSFTMEIDKVSSTKFAVNIESKVVGVNKDLGLKLQVVLTESNIDYSWANGTIDQVNFVARGMFPDNQGTTLNYVGDSIAIASVEIEVDPFVNKENYKVVAFIQHPQYYNILNGDIKSLPITKNVTFSVYGNDNLPLEGAQVSINNELKNTNEQGQAVFGILDNAGELEYSISMQDYENYTGLVNMDTTTNVNVFMVPTGIADLKINRTKIYPNPANENITIETEINSNIIFTDLAGKEIMYVENAIGTKQCDISQLNNGIYIIKVYSGDTIKSFKFLKH